MQKQRKTKPVDNKMSIRGIDPKLIKLIKIDMIDSGKYHNIGEWINDAAIAKLESKP